MKIVKVLEMVNKGSYASVKVIVSDELGNQEEASVYIGGAVEVFPHAGRVKAFVKKGQPNQKAD